MNSVLNGRVLLCAAVILLTWGCGRCNDLDREAAGEFIFQIPSPPLFRSRSLSGLAELFARSQFDEDPFSFRLSLMPRREKQRVLLRTINVQAGFVTFFSKNGYMRFLPSHRVLCKPEMSEETDPSTFSTANQYSSLMVICEETIDSAGMRQVRAFQHVNVRGTGGKTTTQELPVSVVRGKWVIDLKVQRSPEFFGDISDWVVPVMK